MGRKAEVEKRDGRAMGAKVFESAETIFGEDDFIVFTHGPTHLRPNILVVVNDQ
jgi:hypothetical protein